MGITKDYLRFTLCNKFNIISSANCNIVRVKLKDDEKHIRCVASGAAEDIVIWDCKLSKKVRVIEGDKHECLSLASDWKTSRLAAGYRDGTVELYDSSTGVNLSTFSGHSSPVTALSFDDEGHRLASGSMDTEVVVWDIIAEQGSFLIFISNSLSHNKNTNLRLYFRFVPIEWSQRTHYSSTIHELLRCNCDVVEGYFY